MWFLTAFACLYLTASILIGMLSLTFIKMCPEDFDAYRSNDRMKRAENVASVMVLGPIYLLLALTGPKQ